LADSAVDFKLGLSSTKNFGFVYNISKMLFEAAYAYAAAAIRCKFGQMPRGMRSANFDEFGNW
jgi:hypothetical protein